MKTKEKDDRIVLFRVLACLSVFFVHLGQRVNWEGIVRTFSDYGQYGVQLFFVVSGYLAYLSLSYAKSNLEYWYKRLLRICPLYYFVILYFFMTETFIFRDETGLGWSRYIFFFSDLFIQSPDFGEI